MDVDAFRGDWEGIGAFRISGGREILVDPAPEAPPEPLRQFLVGAALAVLLHQRGRLVLHAGAVLTPVGRALLLLGHSGHGKSTMVAECLRQSLQLLSDDLAPLEFRGSEAILYPGAPTLKLWPEAIEAVLGEDAEPLTRVFPHGEKRLYPLEASPTPASVPVGDVVVLQYADAIQLEPVHGAQAIAELTRYSFCARLLGRADGPQHLRQCVALARSARVFRLHRPRDLNRLEEVVQFLQRQLTELSGTRK